MKLIKTCFCVMLSIGLLSAAEMKHLAISDLYSWFSSAGNELESDGPKDTQVDGLAYPQFHKYQDVQCAKGLWIGCKDFDDPTMGQHFDYKVAANGPRMVDESSGWMSKEFKLVGKYPQPTVLVGGIAGARNLYYDALDEMNSDLKADRMIFSEVNTSMGMTVLRKVYTYTYPGHQNYFIYDYSFVNTGVYNADGDEMDVNDLEDVYLYWQWRYGLTYEAADYELKLTADYGAKWGENQVNDWSYPGHDYPGYEGIRAVYSWNGHHSADTEDRLGAPAFKDPRGWGRDNGHLAASQIVGTAVLHADVSVSDKTDDPDQPSTFRWLGSNSAVEWDPDDFSSNMMSKRYKHMEDNPANTVTFDAAVPLGEGRTGKSHADLIQEAALTADAWDPGGAGISCGFGFGPYDMSKGDTIHIVLAEAVGTLDWEKREEVGLNWCERTQFTGNNLYNNASGDLIMPDGSVAGSADDYKAAWFYTGKDSLYKTFDNAIQQYNGDGLDVLPPPTFVEIIPGGDKIILNWDTFAESHSDFSGYRVYRAIQSPDSIYHMIFECGASSGAAVAQSCVDREAVRGFSYYYYVAALFESESGEIMESSKYATMTTQPASLQRMPSDVLKDIRIVPNPYNARAQGYQYGSESGDQNKINFYGLPQLCDIQIYSERGDLVKTIHHTNPTGDESWDQTTETHQIVSSGLYIARIVVLEDFGTLEEGDSIYKKFIIIR